MRLLDPIATNPPYTEITLSSLNNLRYGQVQTCDLTGIRIGNEEAKLLADALKEEVASCMLKTLSLCKTKLTDSAALIIAASLSTHEDLYRLKLTGNPELSDKGASGEYRAERAAYYPSLQENEDQESLFPLSSLLSSPLLSSPLLSSPLLSFPSQSKSKLNGSIFRIRLHVAALLLTRVGQHS